MFGVRVDVEGGERFPRRTAGMQRAARNVSPALRVIHRSFLATQQSRFATEGRGEWAPVAASTAARKARAGQDRRALRATGELERAMTTGRGPGAVTRISRDQAEFGTTLDRARYAQRGRGRERRRFLFVTRRQRESWAAIVARHILEGGGR